MWRVLFKFEVQPKLVIASCASAILIIFLFAQLLPWYGIAALLTASAAVIIWVTRLMTMTEQELRRRKAYHEAGHTIIAWFDPVLPEIGTVTIGDEGSEMKFTNQPTNTTIVSSPLLGSAYLKMLMGGIAAEMEVFRTPCYGGGNDYRYAKWVSMQMRMMGTSQRYNDFEKSYDQARSVIQEKRELLEQVASALLERNTLTTEDLSDLLNSRPSAAAAAEPQTVAATQSLS